MGGSTKREAAAVESIELGALLHKEASLELEFLAAERGQNRKLSSPDVNRPGLALAGFYKNLATDRMQLLGRGECAYIDQLDAEGQQRVSQLFYDYQFPAFALTHNAMPPSWLISAAEESGTPLLRTPLTTHDFHLQYTRAMFEQLAPTTQVHGVMVEVFGVGILLMGPSGIGKSETALELVERGHRLVTDDSVLIRRIGGTDLYGFTSDIIHHHMELRGIGIINVKDLFGVGAIRNRKRIELVVHLEDWQKEKDYERLGLVDEMFDILGVKIPSLVIPVRPGRNVPVLIETAAINQRSKGMGYHAARELSERISQQIQQKALQRYCELGGDSDRSEEGAGA